MLRLFRHYVVAHAVILACCEFVALSSLLYIIFSYIADSGLGLTETARPQVIALVTVAASMGMTAVGLYNRDHFMQMRDVVTRAVVALTLVVGVLLAVQAIYHWVGGGVSDRGYRLLCTAGLGLFLPILLGIRRLFRAALRRFSRLHRRVAVIGTGPRAAKIVTWWRNPEVRPFTLVGFLSLGLEPAPAADLRGGAHLGVAPEELRRFCVENRVDEVVVAAADRRGLPVRDLLGCKLAGVRVIDYATFWERETGQVDLEEVTPGWLAFSDGFQQSGLYEAAARAVDIVVSLALLLLTLPVTLATAALIKLESPGPVFYRQPRVGLHGKVFEVLKFRSMRTDAEKDGPRWAAARDSRVTRVGAVIRKVRIDEIPQVINVLRGEMSFVGPRPERPVFVEELARKIPYYESRHEVKPGITGWAQINYPYGASHEDARRKLSYDLYYIKNRSLFLDAIIILQTVKVLLWNDGAR